MASIVIFGGNGFIGTHLAQHLIKVGGYEKIVLVDIRPPRRQPYTRALQEALDSGAVTYVAHDVRTPIPRDLLPNAEVVYNFAAVHREPGHQPQEYFETNLLGAENVCAWAAATNCKVIVFTSSISPYGPNEDRKTERSLPVPETAYGSSKLVAEKIHLAWMAGDNERRLLIMRPGVVFGPGEGGNVTRLVHSLKKGYFVFAGNRETIKAAGYVKELTLAMSFGLEVLKSEGKSFLLLNFSFNPPPTMGTIVSTIQSVLRKQRRVFSISRGLMMGVAYPVSHLASIFGIQQPVNPVRVRKLFRSTNVAPEQLQALGYHYTYTLESAFLDWKSDLSSDFN